MPTAQSPSIIVPPTAQLTELKALAGLISAIGSQKNLAELTEALEAKALDADAKLVEANSKLAEAVKIAAQHEVELKTAQDMLEKAQKEQEKAVTISKAVDKRDADSVAKQNELTNKLATLDALEKKLLDEHKAKMDTLAIKEAAADEKMAQAAGIKEEAEKKLAKLQGIVNAPADTPGE